MAESLINIKMWFNYIIENKVDMSNFVNHKNELAAIFSQCQPSKTLLDFQSNNNKKYKHEYSDSNNKRFR